MIVEVTLPKKLLKCFEQSRYKVFYGGRGSGKSTGIAIALVMIAFKDRKRILCTREFQNSITESVHQLLREAIDNLQLSEYFTITDRKISCVNGSEFIFKGLRTNPDSVKSLQGIDICWVEEAQTISKSSLEILTPTIREIGSEIWFSLNPRHEDDPVYERFIAKPYEDDIIAVEVNYWDNPWLPEVLQLEMEADKLNDYDLYVHKWEGQCIKISDAIVFNKKWTVNEFVPQNGWFGPYFGLDFGFSNDPAAMVKCWVYDNILYIEKDWAKKRIENDQLVNELTIVAPEIYKYKIRADNSRPETISYLYKNGLPGIMSCKKWAGSVEDGIAFIRSFKGVVIHPSCKSTIYEFQRYSYKVDRLSGDILPILVDKDNHCIDALRYALEPLITQRRPGSVKIY